MTSNRNETIEAVQDDGAEEASESKFWSRDQLSEYYGIQTQGVTKQFSGVKALDDLTLTIPIFGMTSIVGPNGSGKSTLVNLLTGVLPYDDGIVMIETNAFKVIHAHETPDHGITRTFQEVRLFDQMTVWDNMMVVLTNRKLFGSLFERSKASHREKAEQILKQVGMWDKRESLAGRTLLRSTQVARNRKGNGSGCAGIHLGRTVCRTVSADARTGERPVARHPGERSHRSLHLAQHGHRARAFGSHHRAGEWRVAVLSGEVEDILSRPEVIRAYLGA